MNKLELIQAVKDKTGLSKQEAIDLVKLFFDSFTEAMVNGERIEIRGFCSFFIKEYPGYTGRNPKTGKTVQVPAKRMPFFKPGKELKERVDYQTGTTSRGK
ncbi:MAG: integration host factor subunit beta [Thermodesulfobacteriota bacterium]|nr:integration host factor subunit beta [Thermodesulfobacteriota bacterium]